MWPMQDKTAYRAFNRTNLVPSLGGVRDANIKCPKMSSLHARARAYTIASHFTRLKMSPANDEAMINLINRNWESPCPGA